MTESTTTETTRAVIDQLLAAMGAADLPAILAMLDAEIVWEVPGDTENVPWLGRRTIDEVPGFFAAVGEHAVQERFDVDRVVVDGPAGVVIGDAGLRILSTGESITGRFAIEIGVNPGGRITRFFMLEDSWTLAAAVRPQLRDVPDAAGSAA
jgi:ketosteroid isomerase-like protein